MKHIILYIIFLILISPFSSFGQDYVFKETKTNTVKRNYKAILIIGYGSIEARLFLEALSSKIIDNFKLDSIKTAYKYLGKATVQTDKEIKNMADSQYDAIIIFLPKDTAVASMGNYAHTSSAYFPIIGNANYSTTSRIVSYTQNFDIQLYEPSDKSTSVWSALLKIVNADFSKQKFYSRILKTLLTSFKTSKIIN